MLTMGCRERSHATKEALSSGVNLSVGNNVCPAMQAGIDYNFADHWFLNADVKQIVLNTDAHVDAPGTTVKPRTSLDPLVVGMGIGYRF
jgi:outer membrane protein